MPIALAKGKRLDARASRAMISQVQRSVNDAVLQGLGEIATKVVIQAANNIKSKSPYAAIASGKILDKFYVNINKRALTVVVGNRAPEAVFVEYGRRPGKKAPPPRDIKEWLKLKGMPSDPKTVFMMGRKIARYGIKPLYFMARAIETVSAQAPAIINKAVDEAIKREGVTRT